MARVQVVATCLPAIVASATLLVLVKTDVFAARRSQRARDAAAQPTSGLNRHPDANPVIVELFTSEGCSSCPPADALLAKLQQEQPVANANIITLEEHVDYWDHLGWRDRFSSPYITQRQRSYAKQFRLDDVYTPQFVVNGSAQFDGTNPAAMNSAIAQDATATVSLQIKSVEVQDNSSLATVTFTLANIPATQTAKHPTVYAAIIDESDATTVKAGENAGRDLRHVDVVRKMSMAGWLGQDQSKQPFQIQLPSGLNLVKPQLVVFTQAGYGPILGVATHPVHGLNLAPGPLPEPSFSSGGPIPGGGTEPRQW